MEKFCMALVVIALIVNCQLALAQDKTEDEITKEISEAMADLKPKSPAKRDYRIKVPQDVINRMAQYNPGINEFTAKREWMQSEINRLINLKEQEFCFYLLSQGIPRSDFNLWSMDKNGIATRK